MHGCSTYRSTNDDIIVLSSSHFNALEFNNSVIIITLVNVKVLGLVATHWCRLNYELRRKR